MNSEVLKEPSDTFIQQQVFEKKIHVDQSYLTRKLSQLASHQHQDCQEITP